MLLALLRRQHDSGLVEHGRRPFARLGLGHDVILGCARATGGPKCLRRVRHEDIARNLGVRLDGYEVRPGRLQARLANETTVDRVRRAVEGLGDLIDGY